MSERPFPKKILPTDAPSVAEAAAVSTKEATTLTKELPELDLTKLEDLIARGELPSSLIGLYHELRDPAKETPFLDFFREADPEKQKKILSALEKTVEKAEASSAQSEDKPFYDKLISFITMVYVLLAFAPTKNLTEDKAMDPGKNKEGATLRILELNGGEVFKHPEKFEITNVLTFCTDLIDQGHAREVLEHLVEISPAYHATIILRSLELSRSRSGKNEEVYVLEALAHAQKLDVAVAERLCRSKMDEVVLAHLDQFDEADTEKVVFLLTKREKIPLEELLKRVLGLKHALFGEHLVVSLCFQKPKLYKKLKELPQDELEVLLGNDLQDLDHQIVYLNELQAGKRSNIRNLKFIPTVKMAERIASVARTSNVLYLPRVKYLLPDVAVALHKLEYGLMDLSGLEEFGNELASKRFWYDTQKLRLDLSGVKQMAAMTAGLLSERRGWFMGEQGLLVQSDEAARRVAKEGGADFYRKLTRLSVESAKLLAEYRPKGPLSLDGIPALSPDAAVALTESDRDCIISLPALLPPAFGKHFPAIIQRIALRNYRSNPLKIGAGEIQAICEAKRVSLVESSETEQEEALEFKSVRSFSFSAADQLAAWKGPLVLKGLKELPSGIAEILSTHQGRALFLDGLERLTEHAATALGKYKGDLSFGALKEVTVDACDSLAKIPGGLYLDSLHTLEPAQARALCAHTGALYLDGGGFLSPETLRVLSDHRGELSLQQASFSPSIERVFYEKRGWIPGNNVLSDAQARNRVSSFFPDQVKYLSTGLVNLLVKYARRDLDLRSFGEITDEHLALLGQFRGGKLLMTGIKRLSLAGAEALADFPGEIYFDPFIQMEDETLAGMMPFFRRQFERGAQRLPVIAILALIREHDSSKPLVLRNGEYLHLQVATVLGKTEGAIDIKVDALTDPEAACFEGHKGALSVVSTYRMSGYGIASLAENEGPLSLGCKELPLQEARTLATRHHGLLAFPMIARIGNEIIEALRTHKGRVTFEGLTDLTKEMAQFLVDQGGKIVLNNVVHVDEDAFAVLGTHSEEIELNGLRTIDKQELELLEHPSRRKVFLGGVTTVRGYHPHPGMMARDMMFRYSVVLSGLEQIEAAEQRRLEDEKKTKKYHEQRRQEAESLYRQVDSTNPFYSGPSSSSRGSWDSGDSGNGSSGGFGEDD